MTYFVQIDMLTNKVTGYSSNRVAEEDVEVMEEALSERFLSLPHFHTYDKEANIFTFNEAEFNSYKTEKANRLTTDQMLGQKCSDLEIQLMMMQQMMQMSQQV